MSVTLMSGFGAWQQTSNVLGQSLGMNMAMQQASPASSNPGSDYQRAQRNIDQILLDLKAHSMQGLRRLDLSVNPALVKNIKDHSGRAKTAADKIRAATLKINELEKLVADVALLVAKFPGL